MKKSTIISTVEALYAVCLKAAELGHRADRLKAERSTLKDNLMNALPQEMKFIEACQTLAAALDMAKKFHFADVKTGDKEASKSASNKLVACLQAANRAIAERFIEEKAVVFSSHKTMPVAWSYKAEAKTDDEKLQARLQARFPLTFTEEAFALLVDGEEAAKAASLIKFEEEKEAFKAEKLRLAASEVTTVYDHIIKISAARGLDAKTVVWTLFDTRNIDKNVLEGVLAKIEQVL